MNFMKGNLWILCIPIHLCHCCDTDFVVKLLSLWYKQVWWLASWLTKKISVLTEFSWLERSRQAFLCGPGLSAGIHCRHTIWFLQLSFAESSWLPLSCKPLSGNSCFNFELFILMSSIVLYNALLWIGFYVTSIKYQTDQKLLKSLH